MRSFHGVGEIVMMSLYLRVATPLVRVYPTFECSYIFDEFLLTSCLEGRLCPALLNQDIVLVRIDLSVSEMASVQELPGNCGMDISEALVVHHSDWMDTYDYVCWADSHSICPGKS